MEVNKLSSIDLTYYIFIIIFLCIFLFLTSFKFYYSIVFIGISLIFLLSKRKIYINHNLQFYSLLTFIIISFAGLFYGKTPANGGREYFLYLFTSFVIYYFLISMEGWIGFFIESLKAISLIVAISGLFQILLPNFLFKINNLIMTDFYYYSFLNFFEKKILVGMTHNPGVSGFMFCILLFYYFLKHIYAKKLTSKIFYLFLFFFIYIMLFATQKRGLLLYTISIFVILLWLRSKNKIKAFFPALFIILLFSYLLFNTEFGISMIEKTIQQDDITTGRMPVFQIMWDDFKKYPFFGNGTYTTVDVIYLFNGHNIYLQILREQGLFGFIAFISFVLWNLIKTYNLIKLFGNSIEKFYLEFSFSIQCLFIMWGVSGNPLYDIYPFIIYLIGCAISYKLLELKEVKKGYVY